MRCFRSSVEVVAARNIAEVCLSSSFRKTGCFPLSVQNYSDKEKCISALQCASTATGNVLAHSAQIAYLQRNHRIFLAGPNVQQR